MAGDDIGGKVVPPAAKRLLRGELDAGARELIEAAEACRPNAYAPYSHFLVGCALRSSADASIVCGVNLENISYGLSLCAEAAALAACVSQSGDLRIDALAVVGGPRVLPVGYDVATTPCGRCRQLIAESAHSSGSDIPLLCAYPGAEYIVATSIEALLPLSFAPGHLRQ